jgi:hypothetical protein
MTACRSSLKSEFITFTMGSYGVRIGHAWYSQKACEIYSSLVQKKKMKKYIFLHTRCPNSNQPVFGLKEF